MSKTTSNDEALELLKLLEQINRIDLGELEVEKFEKLAPVDQLVTRLEKEGTPMVRVLKKHKKVYKHSPTCSGRCNGICGGNHWKVKAKKRRAYYQEKRKPAKRKKKQELAKTPEGWYQIVTLKWKERRYEFFSLEEWKEILWPHVEGYVPVFSRYDTNKGFTVDNIWVQCNQTGQVIFDGAEHSLRKGGFIL